MCGIVGYVGKREALPILLDGIKNLEYRGYDSAGILVVDSKGKLSLAKSVGKISNLEKKITNQNFSGSWGIVHSRWATHGGVTEANAHPHCDCSKNIWLVHNGIIENFQELKEALLKRGHHFRSQTDTEVIAHLIEEIKKEKGLSLKEAVPLALKKIQGTYGLVILDRREPHLLVAARNFSPLLIGVGNQENIVASDVAAILSHTRKVVYLNDREYALITPQDFEIFNLDSQPISWRVQEIDWDLKAAKKEGFPHFMLKEIFSQPQSLEDSLRGRLLIEEGNAKLGGLERIKETLRKINRLYLVGCGTAYFAAKVGEYMLEEYAQIPTKAEIGSEFRYKKPVFLKGDALVAISQSGETADTLAAVREAKEKGVLTLGIVNVVGSSIARQTDAGVYQHIGPEISVASTKAFTSQIAILALLTLFLGRQRNLSLVMGKRIAQELSKIPSLVKKVLSQADLIKNLANKYAGYKNFLFLGRKYNFPVACEGALKLKEISYVHAEGIGSGEMKHGTIAMIDKNFPSIVLAFQDSVYEKNLSNIQEIKARQGKVIALATQGDKKIKKIADDVIYLPKTLEMLMPILAVIPLQLFAYYFAVLKGLDVDHPRNLAKSVTVE
ncbi:MAG: glutamine--fructose-6-phosphate aminotransferase [isomerizing] [Candidatus Parcubacteria bacterium]|nr:MAG: glutamine--fructose-6-phosphate aminotransferase [isomerizing] [Candidatus Parcubacteria bacterium]